MGSVERSIESALFLDRIGSRQSVRGISRRYLQGNLVLLQARHRRLVFRILTYFGSPQSSSGANYPAE